MKEKYVYLHETVFESWARDASTFALAAALMAPGVYLQSTPMQWVGAIIFFVALFYRTSRTVKRMSFDEARKFLAQADPTPPKDTGE